MPTAPLPRPLVLSALQPSASWREKIEDCDLIVKWTFHFGRVGCRLHPLLNQSRSAPNATSFIGQAFLSTSRYRQSTSPQRHFPPSPPRSHPANETPQVLRSNSSNQSVVGGVCREHSGRQLCASEQHLQGLRRDVLCHSLFLPSLTDFLPQS